jgi:hypothetical protein
MMSAASPKPVFSGTSQFATRPPPPLWIFGATVVLVVTFLVIGHLFLNKWKRQTVRRFLQHARDVDIAECRAMLAEDHSAKWLLDERALRSAANDRLTKEPRSLLDIVRGRDRYSVHTLFQSDHSFTVERGTVTLGHSYWIQYIPPPPPALTRRVPRIEKYDLQAESESDVEL